MAAVALGVLLAFYMLAAGFTTAGVLTVMLALSGWALLAAMLAPHPRYGRPDVMALGMLSMALAVGIGVEFLRVEGDIARMNTLFNYYLVTWLLYAAVASYGFWRIWNASAGYRLGLRRGNSLVRRRCGRYRRRRRAGIPGVGNPRPHQRPVRRNPR